MKKKHIVIIVLVVLIGCITAIVWHNGSKKATFKQDYHIEDTSTITRIFLADKQDNEVLLTRVSDSAWLVDNRYEANQPMIDLFLETLNTMRIRQQVNKNGIPTIIKDLSSRAIKVEVYQKVPFINWFKGHIKLFSREKLTTTYYVGRETQDMMGSYMFREGDKAPCVIHIPGFRGFLTPRFVTDPIKWRSHRIVDLNVNQISSIELQIPSNEEESFVLTNNGSGFNLQISSQKIPVSQFDTVRVAALLSSFTHLNFDEFASIVPKAELDSSLTGTPRAILHITDTAGSVCEVRTYIKYTNPDDMTTISDPDMYEVFDLNRLYAIINRSDTVLIQYQVFDNILQPASYLMGQDTKIYSK